MNRDFPLLIVGAGASGLIAAFAASRARPCCARLLEKEARVGRKLLATGNGRCNLLNASPTPSRMHGSFAPLAAQMLAQTPPEALLATFAEMGLVCRQEAEGRVYPYSGQAGAVLDALRFACERQGVATSCGARVHSLRPLHGGFCVQTDAGDFWGCKVIIAAGGRAAPALGATGDGAGLLTQLGHACAKERPALAPLKTAPQAIRGMKGVRLRAKLSLLVGRRPVQEETGELLFGDASISGVAAMQLARAAGSALAQGSQVRLCIDATPDLDVLPLLRARAALLGKEPAERLLLGLVPTRAALCLLRAAEYPPQSVAKDAPLQRLESLLHAWELPVEGVEPFAQAQVTAGGALAREFSPQTLESLRVPGLYACGEALDFDGDCGGYNLMWAWLSGLRAGTAAAEAL